MKSNYELLNTTYKIVVWPEVQEYMALDTFEENSILITDNKYLEILGSSAYLIDEKWLYEADKKIAYSNGVKDADYNIAN